MIPPLFSTSSAGKLNFEWLFLLSDIHHLETSPRWNQLSFSSATAGSSPPPLTWISLNVYANLSLCPLDKKLLVFLFFLRFPISSPPRVLNSKTATFFESPSLSSISPSHRSRTSTFYGVTCITPDCFSPLYFFFFDLLTMGAGFPGFELASGLLSIVSLLSVSFQGSGIFNCVSGILLVFPPPRFIPTRSLSQPFPFPNPPPPPPQLP